MLVAHSVLLRRCWPPLRSLTRLWNTLLQGSRCIILHLLSLLEAVRGAELHIRRMVALMMFLNWPLLHWRCVCRHGCRRSIVVHRLIVLLSRLRLLVAYLGRLIYAHELPACLFIPDTALPLSNSGCVHDTWALTWHPCLLPLGTINRDVLTLSIGAVLMLHLIHDLSRGL